MNTIDVKELKREIKDLGILNIEAYGSLTLDDIHKTVETVKEMDNILDIDSLLDKNNQKLRKIKG
jgi:hypothetical protein